MLADVTLTDMTIYNGSARTLKVVLDRRWGMSQGTETAVHYSIKSKPPKEMF